MGHIEAQCSWLNIDLHTGVMLIERYQSVLSGGERGKHELTVLVRFDVADRFQAFHRGGGSEFAEFGRFTVMHDLVNEKKKVILMK